MTRVTAGRALDAAKLLRRVGEAFEKVGNGAPWDRSTTAGICNAADCLVMDDRSGDWASYYMILNTICANGFNIYSGYGWPIKSRQWAKDRALLCYFLAEMLDSLPTGRATEKGDA